MSGIFPFRLAVSTRITKTSTSPTKQASYVTNGIFQVAYLLPFAKSMAFLYVRSSLFA